MRIVFLLLARSVVRISPVIALLVFASGMGPRPSIAGDLCAVLANSITVPVKICITPDVDPIKCVLTPHCCLPGGCFVDPLCTAWAIRELTKQIAAGDTYCDFNPDEFVKRWLAGELLNIGDIVAAGLPQTVLDALSAEAQFLVKISQTT